MLIGQVGENGDVDVVLGKALGVLGHAERFEPVRNLLHRGPVAGASGSTACTVYPSHREFEGCFLAGAMFLPSLLAIADEMIQRVFRNASIDGGEVTSWVSIAVLVGSGDVSYGLVSDRRS
jgi:hypothetical protein